MNSFVKGEHEGFHEVSVSHNVTVGSEDKEDKANTYMDGETEWPLKVLVRSELGHVEIWSNGADSGSILRKIVIVDHHDGKRYVSFVSFGVEFDGFRAAMVEALRVLEEEEKRI